MNVNFREIGLGPRGEKELVDLPRYNATKVLEEAFL